MPHLTPWSVETANAFGNEYNYLATSNIPINMPVSGKAYTFKNVGMNSAKSLCIDLTAEQMIATSPTIGVNNTTEVTDLTNDAASNRKGFAGGMWDNME